jgi:hypothetical protein
MAYIGATELSGLLPNAVPTLTGSSRPLNMGEVATICERVSIELDTAAAIAGYLTPIPTTATQAYGQMALYNSWGAACRTLQVIFPGGGNSAAMPLAQDYCNDFKAVLDRIRQSAEILVGAPTDPSETARDLPRSLSTSDPTATSGVQAQSQVGMKF